MLLSSTFYVIFLLKECGNVTVDFFCADFLLGKYAIACMTKIF